MFVAVSRALLSMSMRIVGSVTGTAASEMIATGVAVVKGYA